MKYAGTVAMLGYYKKSESEKLIAHIWFTKPFYESGTELVQSALKAQVNTNFSWQNKYVSINAGGDIKLSDKLDYGFKTPFFPIIPIVGIFLMIGLAIYLLITHPLSWVISLI